MPIPDHTIGDQRRSDVKHWFLNQSAHKPNSLDWLKLPSSWPRFATFMHRGNKVADPAGSRQVSRRNFENLQNVKQTWFSFASCGFTAGFFARPFFRLARAQCILLSRRFRPNAFRRGAVLLTSGQNWFPKSVLTIFLDYINLYKTASDKRFWSTDADTLKVANRDWRFSSSVFDVPTRSPNVLMRWINGLTKKKISAT